MPTFCLISVTYSVALRRVRRYMFDLSVLTSHEYNIPDFNGGYLPWHPTENLSTNHQCVGIELTPSTSYLKMINCSLNYDYFCWYVPTGKSIL